MQLIGHYIINHIIKLLEHAVVYIYTCNIYIYITLFIINTDI